MQPEVRLVAEDSGEVLGLLPNSAPSLSKGDEVVWLENGDTTTYKIEQVRYRAEQKTIVIPDDGVRYSVYGRTEYIVSEV